jgi:putative nucleotidyltransferase with HDIG domain
LNSKSKKAVAFNLYYYATLIGGVCMLAYLVVNHNTINNDWLGWVFFAMVLLFADTKMAAVQGVGGGRVLSSRTLDLSMLALFGPAVAAAAEALSALVRGFILRTTPVRKALYNASMLVITAGTAGIVYHALPYHTNTSSPAFLLPLLAALLVYTALNTLMVGLIMSLERDVPLREMWHRNFWGIRRGVVELPFTAMVVLLYKQAGAWTLLIYLPIIAIIYTTVKALHDTREAHMASIAVLATTLEADEPYTHGHSYRVSQYALLIGRAMGLPPTDLEALEYGGLLHDIGKIAVTNDIICKPGKLTDDEFNTLAEHPAIGARIVEQIKYYPQTVDLVRHHHERPDGKGYPDGLKGAEISLNASIMNVCDAFDAMTSDRSYRRALPISKAIQELITYRGTQFNADVVDIVVSLYERGEFNILPDSDVERVIRETQPTVQPEQADATSKRQETQVYEVQ